MWRCRSWRSVRSHPTSQHPDGRRAGVATGVRERQQEAARIGSSVLCGAESSDSRTSARTERRAGAMAVRGTRSAHIGTSGFSSRHAALEVFLIVSARRRGRWPGAVGHRGRSVLGCRSISRPRSTQQSEDLPPTYGVASWSPAGLDLIERPDHHTLGSVGRTVISKRTALDRSPSTISRIGVII
jgi:hypothetical protein